MLVSCYLFSVLAAVVESHGGGGGGGGGEHPSGYTTEHMVHTLEGCLRVLIAYGLHGLLH